MGSSGSREYVSKKCVIVGGSFAGLEVARRL